MVDMKHETTRYIVLVLKEELKNWRWDLFKFAHNRFWFESPCSLSVWNLHVQSVCINNHKHCMDWQR